MSSLLGRAGCDLWGTSPNVQPFADTRLPAYFLVLAGLVVVFTRSEYCAYKCSTTDDMTSNICEVNHGKGCSIQICDHVSAQLVICIEVLEAHLVFCIRCMAACTAHCLSRKQATCLLCVVLHVQSLHYYEAEDVM